MTGCCFMALVAVLSWCHVRGGEVETSAGQEVNASLPNQQPTGDYALLKEYSPFVKSLESAQGGVKSPDLVAVGYGRIAGENHVIIQLKESSEKREKIGPRFGSKDFPYRLLSITNVYDRKKFIAVLEDRNKKRFEVRYIEESAGSIIGTNPVQNASVSTNAPTNLVAGSRGGAANFQGGSGPAKGLGNGSVSTSSTIEKAESVMNDPNAEPKRREVAKKIYDAQVKKQALQQSTDLITPSIEAAPEPEPEPEPAP